MVKRGAEDQLTKDDEEREGGETGEAEGGGMTRASAAEIAARPIRALRTTRRAATPAEAAPPSNPFGAPAGSSPFTFGKPAASPLPAPGGFGGFGVSNTGAGAGSTGIFGAGPPAPVAFPGFGAASGASVAGSSGGAPTFSFGGSKPPGAAPYVPAPSSLFGGGAGTLPVKPSAFPAAAPADAPKPFAGFSFKAPGAPTPTPLAPATPFVFGATPSSTVPAAVAKPPSFAFGSTGAETPMAPTPADKPTLPPSSSPNASSPFTFGAPPTSGSSSTPSKPPPFAFGSPAGPAPAASKAAEKPPTPLLSSSKPPPFPTFGRPSGPPASSSGSTFGTKSIEGLGKDVNGDAATSKNAFAPLAGSSDVEMDGEPGSAGSGTSEKQTSSASGMEDKAKVQKEKEYLTAVRGLNESVVRAFQTRLLSMPFADLGGDFDGMKAEYQAQLSSIQRRAGVKGASKDGPSRAEVSKVDQVRPAVTAMVDATPPPVKPITPGTGFRFNAPIALLPNPSSTAPPVGGSGFVPSGINTAGISLAPGASDKDSNEKTVPAPAPASTPAPATFPFGAPAAKSVPRSEASKLIQDMLKEPETEMRNGTSAEPAGVLDKPTPPARKRAASPTLEAQATPKRQSGLFEIKPSVKAGTSPSMVIPTASLGSGGAVPFVFKAAAPGASPAFASSSPLGGPSGFGFPMQPVRRVPSTGFGFGRTSSTPGTPSAAEASGSKPSNPFSFGAPPNLAASSGTVAPPSMFSFGAPSAIKAADDASASSSAAEPAKEDEGGADNAAEKEPQMDLSGSSSGEEGEEVIWGNQLRVNSSTLGADAKWGNWVDCNVRLLRLKAVEGEGADSSGLGRRFVMRATSTGVISQNFSLKAIIRIEVKEKTIHLVVVAPARGTKEVALSFGKALEERQEKMQTFRAALKKELEAVSVNTGDL